MRKRLSWHDVIMNTFIRSKAVVIFIMPCKTGVKNPKTRLLTPRDNILLRIYAFVSSCVHRIWFARTWHLQFLAGRIIFWLKRMCRHFSVILVTGIWISIFITCKSGNYENLEGISVISVMWIIESFPPSVWMCIVIPKSRFPKYPGQWLKTICAMLDKALYQLSMSTLCCQGGFVHIGTGHVSIQWDQRPVPGVPIVPNTAISYDCISAFGHLSVPARLLLTAAVNVFASTWTICAWCVWNSD